MNVVVSFIGFQKNLTETDRIKIPLCDRIKVVADLFGFLRKKYPQLILEKDAVLVTVNNIATSLDYRLSADDEISFIPHIGGG